MAGKAKMKCLCCSAEFIVKVNDRATINASCPLCDLTAYAKEGTEAHARLSRLMQPIKPASVEPVAAGDVAPEEQKGKPKTKEKMPWER